MRLRLSGINTIRRKLADGTVRTYYYHRLSGTRLYASPGSPEFLAEIAEAERRRKQPRAGSMKALLADYMASSSFTEKAPKTQASYRQMIRLIEDEFGDAPLEVISDHRIRGDFLAWRDRIAQRSKRTADYALTVLGLILQWGYDRGRIAANHARNGKRLYKADRSDRIWLPEHVASFLKVAPAEVQLALWLALYTGQRQGDLLKLKWIDYDGSLIRLRQGKSGRRVEIPVSEALARILSTTPRRGAHILTTKRGNPWRADHFRHSWRAASRRAGITDLHFHDLRGTTVTLLSEQGASPQEIATITGHSLNTVQHILDTYSARTRPIAMVAAAKLEKALAASYEAPAAPELPCQMAAAPISPGQ
ncbi:tyrosine-type recombinase/integrase [Rhodoligotrophos defluvii]|uniref:tyrosine-type recombinase/integrase n=1 Tax=Rhodoligotrophos defluvii TaxID=2561934 RepID=UPI001485B576|nr:tyrosine-type recombinase/integrase [Rhodoligotrophos defluvii]